MCAQRHWSKNLKIKIRGRRWRVKYLSDTLFKTKFSHRYVGMCVTSRRKLYFNQNGLTKSTVLHELIHAYMAESYLTSATKLKIIDYEEIVCDTLSEFWDEILEHAMLIIMKGKENE